MGSRPARQRYCRCGTQLAADNPGRQCARCERASRDKLVAPPAVAPEFWQTEQFRAAFAAQHLGMVSRAYRTHPHHHAVYGPSGISQDLLGQWVGLSQPHVSRIENGRPVVHLDTLQHWAQVLRIPSRWLWFDMPPGGQGEPTTEVVPRDPVMSARGVLESPAEIAARRAGLHADGLTEELVAELERFLAELPDRYEEAGPLVLAPEAVDARRLVHRLLAGNQRLTQRATLFDLAGRLSGQLSYMAVNLGNFGAAQAYGSEAFELADFIGHDELAAWVRGTQSLAAYYTGDYQRSLVLAEDGQRYAKGGIQAVRLAINGEARASGKLGDQRGTAAAVSRAYRLLEKLPPAQGMTPCISFGIYSEARTASNAATAYLALRQTKQVLGYAERAREIVDRSPSQWSYALIRLDMASALLSDVQPEPEGASALGAEAIDAVRYLRIESIQQRARELVLALRPWRHLPTVATFLEDARAGWPAEWTAVPPGDQLPPEERDWHRFRQLRQLHNHWQRPGWSPGRRSYHWFLTFEHADGLRELAAQCQEPFRHLPQFDLVPLDSLHLTLHRLAFTDELSVAQLPGIVAAVRQRCSALRPLRLRVGWLAGSAGAIRLTVLPTTPITGLRETLMTAAQAATGKARSACAADTSFWPHISIAYSNTDQPAAPITARIEELRSLPRAETVVSSVALVELRREGRAYWWDEVEHVELGR